MKKLFSILILPVLFFSFAIAEPEIGTLEWEILFWAGRLRDAEVVSCVMDDADPENITCFITLAYSFTGSDHAVASRFPEYCRQVLDHAATYPECAGITFRWVPAGEGRESTMVYSVADGAFTLTEASGLVLVLIPTS